MREWDEILHDSRIDDSGNYDYLAEELPENTVEWVKHCHCEGCGRKALLAKRSTCYFYCYDGWDSMSYTECLKCYVKHDIRILKQQIKNRRKSK